MNSRPLAVLTAAILTLACAHWPGQEARAAGGPPLRSASSLQALDGAVSWLHSPPLTPAALQGKVVLLDFWTYSCIVGSSRVDLQACKLEYSIVSPK